jgi:hypothetical protein
LGIGISVCKFKKWFPLPIPNSDWMTGIGRIRQFKACRNVLHIIQTGQIVPDSNSVCGYESQIQEGQHDQNEIHHSLCGPECFVCDLSLFQPMLHPSPHDPPLSGSSYLSSFGNSSFRCFCSAACKATPSPSSDRPSS